MKLAMAIFEQVNSASQLIFLFTLLMSCQ